MTYLAWALFGSFAFASVSLLLCLVVQCVRYNWVMENMAFFYIIFLVLWAAGALWGAARLFGA